MYHSFTKCKDILPDVLRDAVNRYNTRSFSGDIQTGFKDLDAELLGINRSELVCITGMPVTNPDILTLNMIANISKENDSNILIINLSAQTINRNLQKWLSLSRLNKIINNIDISFDEIVNKIEDFAKNFPDGIIFINGLERLFADYVFTRYSDIEKCGLTFKRMARTLNIPIVVTFNLKLKNEPKKIIPSIGDLGIFDVFACVSDKILTTFHYRNFPRESKQDYFINIAKNKAGFTGLLRYGIYLETEIICDPIDLGTEESNYAVY